MRNYECLFIVNPNFDGDGISTVIEKVTGYVKEADADVANIQHWGKRRLAYQIEKQQYGNYVLMHLNGEAPRITDLQRSLELDDSVLAYMTVRLDEMPEFDKVMIPEDDSEDDRRGGRSRYEGSRSRSGGSYSRDGRNAEPGASDADKPKPKPAGDAKAEVEASGQPDEGKVKESVAEEVDASAEDVTPAEPETEAEPEVEPEAEVETEAEPEADVEEAGEKAADDTEAQDADDEAQKDDVGDGEEDDEKKEEA